MSYLTGPRLVFAGQFMAQPSTVNNLPVHFNNQSFTPNDQVPGDGNMKNDPPNGSWNPNGGGQFGFVGCVVQQVVYGDGTTCSDSAVEPIIGATVNSSPSGKIVDLDSQNQGVSTVFGFGVSVTPSTPNTGFSGQFTPAPFADLWSNFPAAQSSSGAEAFYQSVLVLQKEQWLGVGSSRFLQELSAGGTPSELSIRFIVDNYNGDSTSESFTLGRVVGSIGPYTEGEPIHFVAGRVLNSNSSNVNTAYAQIAGDVLSIDLSNSLPVQSLGGPIDPSVGTLTVALQPVDGSPAIPIGTVDPLPPNWYEQTAGVVSFKLTPQQLSLASQSPLVISGSGTLQLMLQEPADDFVFRLNPGATTSTTFYLTIFGQRANHQQISLAFDSSSFGPRPPVKIGTPESALSFPLSITTGTDGTATLLLMGSDPGNPRNYIDGQIYGVVYAAGPTAPLPGAVGNASQMLNALVWSAYPWDPKTVNWTDNVQPILQQYANLYPVMKPFIDLSNYESVTNSAKMITRMFSLPITDANYMPVTRDLSQAKNEMILSWLSETPPKKDSLTI